MKYFTRLVAFTLFALFLISCDPSKKIILEPQLTMLDTMEIVAQKPASLKTDQELTLPKYNPSYTRTADLIHTKLDLKFNWQQEAVIGVASLSFTPVFYPISSITLDAQGFELNSIRLKGQSKSLQYEYDQKQIVIYLGRSFSKGETFEINIDYTAFPSRLSEGGSAAITSDQGLFFINPNGEDPNKPQQIWTQGETEHNSRWFPTVDKPNERCTQEVLLTVKNKYTTLSNGLMIGSVNNNNGTRTDHWKMDLPHAPYLFMLAIGEFSVTRDKWNNIPVDYYVEKEYEKDAKAIFNHTPEMLQFFSDLLGYPYPWPKFSQVVVRDYVSGAMENTSAVIYGEFVQRKTKDLPGNTNDRIIAHEMFHHWFGDLVTCESWSNLTMNEGFANYSEYLWLEHKYGKDEANEALRGDQQGYFESTSMGGMHPLIHFKYENKESMFDAHSYNKGGAVLHMLRNEVGDEAFFTALQLYLTENQYTAVEVHNLRLAFEKVTGRDLNWFFNQWYLSQGHPVVESNYTYDSDRNKLILNLKQTQDPARNVAIFQLPIEIDIYLGKRMPIREKIFFNQREQSFEFDVIEAPVLVNVDAENSLLWLHTENLDAEQYTFQYSNAKGYKDRYDALSYLENNNPENHGDVFMQAINDPFWALRVKALNAIDWSKKDKAEVAKMAKLANTDSAVQVRSTVLEILGGLGNSDYSGVLEKAIKDERTYAELGSALQSLSKIDPSLVKPYLDKLKPSNELSVILAVAGALGSGGNPQEISYFEEKLPLVTGFNVFPFFEPYTELVLAEEDSQAKENRIAAFKNMAMNSNVGMWKRFCAARMIVTLRDHANAFGKTDQANGYDNLFKEIKTAEQNGQLKSIYGRF